MAVSCPKCGYNGANAFGNEWYDEVYCEFCSYEQRTKRATPRPMKKIEFNPSPPPDKKKKKFHDDW